MVKRKTEHVHQDALESREQDSSIHSSCTAFESAFKASSIEHGSPVAYMASARVGN